MTFETNIFEGCSNGLFYCYARWINTITNGVFWPMFVIAFGIMLYMATARYGNSRAFGYSCFGVVVLTFYFLLMDLIIWQIASLYFIVGGIGLVIMRMSEGR